MERRGMTGIRVVARVWVAGWILVSLGACRLSAQGVSGDEALAAPRIAQLDFGVIQAAGRVLVVDVRDEASYKAGHIRGAINVPVRGGMGVLEEFLAGHEGFEWDAGNSDKNWHHQRWRKQRRNRC